MGSKQPWLASETLYNQEFEKRMRQEEAESQHARAILDLTARKKINSKSNQYLRSRLRREIRYVFELLDVNKRGRLGITHALLIFQHFGLLPDVLMMNLEGGGKERDIVLKLWKVIRVSDDKNEADIMRISAVISAVILENSSAVSSKYTSALNIQGGSINSALGLNFGRRDRWCNCAATDQATTSLLFVTKSGDPIPRIQIAQGHE